MRRQITLGILLVVVLVSASLSIARNRGTRGAMALNALIPAGSFISDDFNDCELDSQWTFLDPCTLGDIEPPCDPATGEIVGAGTEQAHFEITIPATVQYDLWSSGGNRAARLMQPAADTDLEIHAGWLNEPSVAFHDQGVLIEQDALNFIRFDRFFNGSEVRLFSGVTQNGVNTERPTGPATPDERIMRITRTAETVEGEAVNRWQVFLSADGVNFDLKGDFTLPAGDFTVNNVGVYAANLTETGPDQGFTSQVDFFINTGDPINEDGEFECSDQNACTADSCDEAGMCADSVPLFNEETQCCDTESGEIQDRVDGDGDGVTGCDGDCNDADPAINPNAAEICDGIDNNCDEAIDEGFGVGGTCSVGIGECAREGTFVCTQDGSGTECDTEPGNPGPDDNPCDGLDNDCDGLIDEDCTCGDGDLDDGEECDDGNAVDGDGCSSSCQDEAECGNGVPEPGEDCDDGNDVNGDGCDTNCTFTACGNGIVTGDEECDDGNDDNTDGCVNCLDNVCGDGFVWANIEPCDDGNTVNGDGCDNNCTLTACGNGELSDGETCDDGNNDDGDGCDSNCTTTACGNGVVTSGEECDDGNTDNTDGCVGTCQLAECGDGFVYDGVEPCDDGNSVDGDGCDNNCTLTACGNGVVTTGEECDDGNNDDTDGCIACVAATCGDSFVWAGVEDCDDANSIDTDACIDCVAASCGDGIVWDGVEACDDGNTDNTDECANCAAATCGDGFVWAGNEACDDGNNIDTDGCIDCTNAVCGDGIVWDGVEDCDDANSDNTDSCVMGCNAASCGDGYLWAGVEDCDDGNTTPGDGCSSTCLTAECGNGVVEGDEECDDGNAIDTDSCLSNCHAAQCGDGIAWAGVEGCDDGNSSNTDSCLNNCHAASCGDTYLWAGEEDCDDGNTTPGDGCRADCTVEVCGDGHVDPGEQCDLGDDNGGKNCSDTCHGVNHIKNGDFELGRTYWIAYSNSSISFSVSGRMATISGAPATNSQLLQRKLNYLLPGQRYKVSFRARSTTGRNFRVQAFHDRSQANSFGLNYAVDATPTWQHFETTFWTPEKDLSNGRFTFNFAGYITAGTTYQIDNVVLELYQDGPDEAAAPTSAPRSNRQR